MTVAHVPDSLAGTCICHARVGTLDCTQPSVEALREHSRVKKEVYALVQTKKKTAQRRKELEESDLHQVYLELLCLFWY